MSIALARLVVQLGQPGDESLPVVSEGGMSEGAIPEGQGSAESHAQWMFCRGCPSKYTLSHRRPLGRKVTNSARPCGMDSGIITDAGIVTDPIGQIRIFMNTQTPSFEAVVEAIVARLLHQYRRWIQR